MNSFVGERVSTRHVKDRWEEAREGTKKEQTMGLVLANATIVVAPTNLGRHPLPQREEENIMFPKCPPLPVIAIKQKTQLLPPNYQYN